MIIPARWYAGGKGLDEFRNTMLNDHHIIRLVDYVNAKDCFSGVSIGGGICYFLWSRDESKDCLFTSIHDRIQSTKERKLNEFPVFIRYNEALSIVYKAHALHEPSFSECISTRNPFGLSSSERGDNNEDAYTLYSSGGIFKIARKKVTAGTDMIHDYKIMLSKVTSEHAGEPDQSGKFMVLSKMQVLEPNEVCTDSYLIAYHSNDKTFVQNCYSYMTTKFFRFLLLQAISSINLSKDKFQFVPMQDFTKPWTDNELYYKYKLTQEEIDFIENMIRAKD